MLVWSRHNICTWPHTNIISFFLFFSYFFNFVICKLCQIFPFIEQFFLEFTLLKRNSQFLQKHLAAVRKFTKKNHFSVQNFFCFSTRIYLLDRPCNFSFSPQAAPFIATGQGEPAPTLVHSPSWARRLTVFVDSAILILSWSTCIPKL